MLTTVDCCTGTTSGTPSQATKKSTQVVELEVPQQKRTRRKLMDSPVKTPSPAASKRYSLPHLEDSLSKEVRPIIYTPESCRKPVQSCSMRTVVKQDLHLPGPQEANECNANMQLKKASVMDLTCDVIPECDEGDMNSTVILYERTAETNEASVDSSIEQSQPCSSSILQRYLPLMCKRTVTQFCPISIFQTL